MMTDPIADMLTRIRNAVRIERASVQMPSSLMKQGVADSLKSCLLYTSDAADE